MNSLTEHVKQVSRWLDENVHSYLTPRTITLAGFEIDLDQMSGRFYVSLDGQRIPEPFRISLAQNGWVQLHPPMFTSPLGAPASYSAVDLTDETKMGIEKALKSVFPRLKPMGIDLASGSFIGQGTSVKDRVQDPAAFEKAMSRATGRGFFVTVPVVE